MTAPVLPPGPAPRGPAKPWSQQGPERIARVAEGHCLPDDDHPLVPVLIDGERWGLCTLCPAAWAVRGGVLLRMPVSRDHELTKGQEATDGQRA